MTPKRTYADANRSKATFDDVYRAATPHAYLHEMRKLGYQIGERARPYCLAAARLVEREDPEGPLQMLDVGCSYGVGSAFVRFGCSFEELVSFFESRAPEDYEACTRAMRSWLHVTPPAIDMRVVGLDASESAIHFAIDAGLLDEGISRDLETEDLDAEERAAVARCNLLICTGAIGYVGKPTFRRILAHLGESRAGRFGPVVVATVLRMFDLTEVKAAFQEAGYEFERVEGARLPQRAFASDQEHADVSRAVQARGLDTRGLEDRGVLYADVYAGCRAADAPKVRAAMASVRGPALVYTRQLDVARSEP